MLILSRLRLNWINLPNLATINKDKPIFLYLFSKDIKVNTEFFDIFSKNNEIGKKVTDMGISCYTQDVSLLPTEYIDKFEVRTVPIIIGIFKGNKVGHVLNDGNSDKFISLCDKLKSISEPVESEIVSKLKQLLNHGNMDDLRATLSHVKKNMVRELEVNPTLFDLVSRATIISHNNKEFNLNSLNIDLQNLNKIINEIEVYNLSGEFTGETPENRTNYLNTLSKKYFNTTYQTTNNKENNKNEEDKNNSLLKNNLKTCYILKLHILKLLSVKYFMNYNKQKSVENILQAYKLNVKLLEKNIFSIEEFESWDGKEVIESLFAWLDPKFRLTLESISEVENIIGKRNLNEIPVSTKPKGGVVRKHRGYGGRYIWQGMEYRPKKYKPRNLRQYLGDFKFVYESNPPSFN